MSETPSTPLYRTVRQIGMDLVADLAWPQLWQGVEEPTGGYEQLARAMDRCLSRLTDLALWGTANREPSLELWNVAGEPLSRGWLQYRARTKPRGYAGDHELLGRMYSGQCCDDPLGRLFDRYFLGQAAPLAVRHRMEMMRGWIVEEVARRAAGAAGGGKPPLKVAMVGSAFGAEIRDALGQLTPDQRAAIEIVLLDIDPAAAATAEQQLAGLAAEGRLRAVGANIFRLPQRPNLAELLDDSDLLFCPGLFDYLDDAAAAAMLRCLYERLAPGGRLVVFQFAPHNPTRAYMEWLASWYLIYRDLAAFQGVVAAAGISAEEAEFGAEPQGVDLFVSIRRGGLPVRGGTRTDTGR